MDFISLAKDESYALHEDYGSVIKFKYSKPRVYEYLIKAKSILEESLDDEIELGKSQMHTIKVVIDRVVVKEENKERDGNPEIKQKIRQIQISFRVHHHIAAVRQAVHFGIYGVNKP